MTPSEKGAIIRLLWTIANTLSNMSSTETDYNRMANLQELESAVVNCIDSLEGC